MKRINLTIAEMQKQLREQRKQILAQQRIIDRAHWIEGYRPKKKPTYRLNGEELRRDVVYMERLINDQLRRVK